MLRQRATWWGLAMTVALLPHASADAQPAVAGAAPSTVRAVGMPLRDGALPPGMLTVRVVRSGFTDVVVGVDVVVDIDGQTRTSRTGADGRAQFAHLPVGARLRAAVVVGGRTLESETFAVPAESGVRLLLAAGGDGDQGLVAHGPASTPQPSAAPLPAPAPPRGPVATDVKTTLALCASAGLAILWLLRRRRA